MSGNPFIIAEDAALKSWIQGMVVSDDTNPNRTVKVWYGFPDVEIRTQDFPFVTIDIIDILTADYRQSQGEITDTTYDGTIAAQGGIEYTYEVPVAYDLIYQVTSYSRHPRHDRAIMYQLLTKFPSKYGWLNVPNQLGTDFTSRTMLLDGFVKRDSVEGETGNRRLLRNVLTVRVLSEMTPTVANAIATKLVQTVKINATTSYIPSGYTPTTI